MVRLHYCSRVCLLAVALFVTAVFSESVRQVVQSKETITIKNKLATAEGRVTDLISRLDSVSDDATRAKNEIHATLMEVWKIVDLLGRDRCGDVVDKVRVAQKKAENKVTEQQEEMRTMMKEIETLKLQLAKGGDSVVGLQKEINAERSRRETLETEARELRDKLHWASAVTNETQKYELVAERLQNLLVIVSERTNLLNRIMTMVGDSHSGFEEWRKEIDSINNVIRDAGRDFAGGFKTAASESLRRQNEDLERRLKETMRGRENLNDERNTLRRSLEGLQSKLASAGSIVTGQKVPREKVFIRAESGTSMLGVITLCLISLCTGAVAVFFLSNQGGDAGTGGSDAEKYGFTPQSTRTSPGFQRASPSPFPQSGGASRTPGSRGSTPRRY